MQSQCNVITLIHCLLDLQAQVSEVTFTQDTKRNHPQYPHLILCVCLCGWMGTRMRACVCAWGWVSINAPAPVVGLYRYWTRRYRLVIDQIGTRAKAWETRSSNVSWIARLQRKHCITSGVNAVIPHCSYRLGGRTLVQVGGELVLGGGGLYWGWGLGCTGEGVVCTWLCFRYPSGNCLVPSQIVPTSFHILQRLMV